MTTIHFNTSRLYTQHGQRITAQVNPDGTVLFNDHSRMIWGKLNVTRTVPFFHDQTFAEYLMNHYDRGNYTPSVEANELTWDPSQENLWRL